MPEVILISLVATLIVMVAMVIAMMLGIGLAIACAALFEHWRGSYHDNMGD